MKHRMKQDGITQKVRWKKSERFERIGEFDIDGGTEDIFPLLCPVLEYEWLPGWTCTMCYSVSGVAEENAVFHTKETHGRKAVWTTITYEPDTFIEYLIVSGTDAVIRLSIALKQTGGKTTHVTWKMLFTATSALSAKILNGSFSEAKFAEMTEDRQVQLNSYLSRRGT